MLAGYVGAAACCAGFAAWAVRGKSSAVFGPSVWRGPRDKPRVALTFDDGPTESTPHVLRLLEAHGARGTFFQCGSLVARHPEIAARLVAGGHEPGNHGYSHTRMDFRGPDFIFSELRDTQRAIVDAAGAEPRLFRAPYGVRWFGMREAQRRLNLLGVMWTSIARDWKLAGPQVAARLLAAASNGAIFCLHDGRAGSANPDIRSTLDALEILLPELKNRGFELVTVSRLLGAEA